mmetsp:Transcript_37372/g.107306  ORF Transcript_37372/g.107306 Transcript_37372/m.107306 type:complete len:114 (-) Transcript_37372:294-635(-)
MCGRASGDEQIEVSPRYMGEAPAELSPAPRVNRSRERAGAGARNGAGTEAVALSRTEGVPSGVAECSVAAVEPVPTQRDPSSAALLSLSITSTRRSKSASWGRSGDVPAAPAT